MRFPNKPSIHEGRNDAHWNIKNANLNTCLWMTPLPAENNDAWWGFSLEFLSILRPGEIMFMVVVAAVFAQDFYSSSPHTILF